MFLIFFVLLQRNRIVVSFAQELIECRITVPCFNIIDGLQRILLS